MINFVENLKINNKTFSYYSLKILSKDIPNIYKLPVSFRVLIENLLRNSNNLQKTKNKIKNITDNYLNNNPNGEINFFPSRVLMQDFTGVPALADLASMRDKAEADPTVDPYKVNPLKPVDLVIDHSIMVDKFATNTSLKENVNLEYKRNLERYKFLKWGQEAFKNFRVIPPGVGICHQVNMEFLSKVVWIQKENNILMLYPDSLVGTDSHTTMVNGMAVLGWGVGGIEAEAVMLGEAVSMSLPKVVGVKLIGTMPAGTTATDLVLTITNVLRKHGVVGKFVEYYGPALKKLSLADRATISNMAPEYGATCGFFPVDSETIYYLKQTGRDEEQLKIVEKYSKIQKLWHDPENEPVFNENVEINLSNIEPVLAGPKRPQDKVSLSNLASFNIELLNNHETHSIKTESKHKIQNGDLVIAAITSCTNTSNAAVMIAAGLLAKKAVELGLDRKEWVKTSLAPGSQVVTDYLQKLGLLNYLEKIGFNVVGYGCTTCIGNSGPLEKTIEDQIVKSDLHVVSVLSGNRNFEGRVHPLVKSNWLGSPPLVVAYSLLGNIVSDITREPIGLSNKRDKVFLKDIWPSQSDIYKYINKIDSKMYVERYSKLNSGKDKWDEVMVQKGSSYNWDSTSTYVKKPPFLSERNLITNSLKDIKKAKILAILGDSITTDHISPAGTIKDKSPAGKYLSELQVNKNDFNSYGSRRGNHEIMSRGTFANIRLKNLMNPDKEGGYTTIFPEKKIVTIYEAADHYARNNIPLVVFAGKEYGTGSSRDWAAKGTKLLGVKAIIAESFERIHRSNLVGMGVLPIQLPDNLNWSSKSLIGNEFVNIRINEDFNNIKPNTLIDLKIFNEDNSEILNIDCLLRVDTFNEFNYLKEGNILNYVFGNMSV